MRLQSRFKDYYDFISHRFGGDPSCVYVREPPRGSGTGYFLVDACDTEDGFKDEIAYAHRLKYDMRYIIIGTRVYPFVHDRVRGDMHLLVKEGGTGIDRFLAHNYKTKGPSYPEPIPVAKLENLIRAVGAPVFEVVSIDVSWTNKTSPASHRSRKTSLKISGHVPVLADLGFPSFLPAKDAWQEIYTTLTSVLRRDPDKEVPVKLSNNDRVMKAGFDLKSSFRHPVNEKKARR